VYATYSDNTNLKLDVYDVPNMVKQRTVDLGTGTTGQATSKTQVAYPEPAKNGDLTCHIYGRMSNPAGMAADPMHVIKTIDGGVSFANVESGWGTDNCGGLVSAETGRIFAMRNVNNSIGALYSGTSGLNIKSTVPYEVNPGGVAWINNYFIACADAAGNAMVRYTAWPLTRWWDLSNGYPNSGGITGLAII